MIILYSKLILSVVLVIALIIVIAPLIAIFCVPGLAKVERKIASKVALSYKHVKQEIGKNVVKKFQNGTFHAIFPGTLWCGDGDIAGKYENLGYYRKEDACCREHDHCPDSITAGNTSHGLTNTFLTTFSACECDEAFYKCLRNASSAVSSALGFALFTLLGAQCFKEEFPIIRCAKMDTVNVRGYQFTRCGKYLLNKTAPRKYQWFDNPLYPVPDIGHIFN